MRRFFCGGLGLLAIVFWAGGGVAHEATSKGVTVAHPWVRATPGGVKVGGAFLEVKTDAKTSDRLLSVSSPVAGRAEMHTTIAKGDVMTMRQLEHIDLNAGESRVFKPGGDHIMLLDLKQPLKEGDLVKLTLTFEKAGPIEVEATVEPIGATGPHGMDHQPVEGGENSGTNGGAEHSHP